MFVKCGRSDVRVGSQISYDSRGITESYELAGNRFAGMWKI